MASCEFECHIEDTYINGVDMIEWNALNKIISFKVLIRPLKGLHLLKDKMAEKLINN